MLPKTPDQPSTLTERRPESQEVGTFGISDICFHFALQCVISSTSIILRGKCAPPMACSSRVVLPSTACTLRSRVTPVQRPLQCIPLALRTLVLKPVSCSLRSIGEFSPSLKKRQCGVKASMAEVSNETRKGKVQVYDSEEELAVALAEYAARLSEKYAKERGAFTVVVSGGSLIKSLRKLTEAPYIDSVDWSKWHMFWVDERVVPKDHPDSNYLLAYNGFLSKVPIPPGNVYAINDSLSAEAAADDYETNLKHLVKNKIVETSKTSGFPKFDVMLLGMGPDGHVASLFPGHPLVQESKKWVTFIKDSPKPPPDRITFTFPVINSSAHIALAVVGAGKAGVVHQALGDDGQGSPKLPVAMVSPEGELTWFLDKEAASKL